MNSKMLALALVIVALVTVATAVAVELRAASSTKEVERPVPPVLLDSIDGKKLG